MSNMSNMSNMSKYEVVAEFPSKSSKTGKVHIVKRHLETGDLSCSCPAWIFNTMARECAHTLKVQVQQVQQGQAATVRKPNISDVRPDARRSIVLE